MRWKTGGQRAIGHECIFVIEGNRLGVIFGCHVLARALYCEVNASLHVGDLREAVFLGWDGYA